MFIKLHKHFSPSKSLLLSGAKGVLGVRQCVFTTNTKAIYTLENEEIEPMGKYNHLVECTLNPVDLFRIDKAKRVLNNTLDKEINYEKSTYSVNEKILNLITQMGFYLVESDDKVQQKLIKRTGEFLIEITYDIRAPLMKIPDNDEEIQHEQMMKKYAKYKIVGEKDNSAKGRYYTKQNMPYYGELDDPRDVCHFFINVINRKNRGLLYECYTIDGEIHFGRLVHTKDALRFIELSKAQMLITNKYLGPQFYSLNNELQLSLIEHLYSLGVFPDIGLCVEYLSVNKEQRMYIQWMKNMKESFKASE